MEDCIFCKIVAGQAPCCKLYENDHVLAFLDINPISDFHSLFIPKKHYARVEDIDDETAAALGLGLTKLGKVFNKLAEGPDYNILLANGVSAGQEVFHCHYHFIPRVPRDGLGYRWKKGGRLPIQSCINEFLGRVHQLLEEPSGEGKGGGEKETI